MFRILGVWVNSSAKSTAEGSFEESSSKERRVTGWTKAGGISPVRPGERQEERQYLRYHLSKERYGKRQYQSERQETLVWEWR